LDNDARRDILSNRVMRFGALALLSWLVVGCTTGGAGGSVPATTSHLKPL
jgi:hypothetical protein